jgi:microcystin-dependent protein
MPVPTDPHPAFAPGDTAFSAQVNARFKALFDALDPGEVGLDEDNFATSFAALLFESGDLKASARATPSTGWLLCDGSAVSRTTFAGLFGAIGTAYGAGDGSSTFNLPDYRGRALVGLGTASEVNARGDNDGMAVGNRKPQHYHVEDGSWMKTGATGTFSASDRPASANDPPRAGGFNLTFGDETGPVNGPAYQVSNIFIKT